MIKSSVSCLVTFINSVIFFSYIAIGLMICAGAALLYFAIRWIA